MKKILSFLIVCVFALPIITNAADIAGAFADIGEDALSAAVQGIKEGFEDMGGTLTKDQAADLATMLKSNPALKTVLAGLDRTGCKYFTPEARTAAISKAFKEAVGDDDDLLLADSIDETALTSFVDRLTSKAQNIRSNILRDMKIAASRNLLDEEEGMSLSEFEAAQKEIDSAFNALQKASDTAFAELTSTVITRVSAALVQQFGSQVGKVVEDAASSAAQAVEESTEIAAGMSKETEEQINNILASAKPISDIDQAAQALEKPGYIEQFKTKWSDASKLDDLRNSTEQELFEAKAAANKAIGTARLGKDATGNEELTLNSGFKPGALNKNTLGVVKDNGKDFPIKFKEYEITENADGSLEITMGGERTPFSFTIKNPTALERSILSQGSGKAELTVSKAGNLTFKTTDQGLLTSAKTEIGALNSTVESIEKDLAQIKAKVQESSYALQRFGRWFGRTAKAFIREPFAEMEKAFTNLLHKIEELGKMILQGVFFGIPSMIYQALMQEAQNAAMYAQIASPYQISVDPALWVKIPPKLIPSHNPQSATFLYAACASDGSNQSKDDFYVMYQSGYPWGSTYATSSTASGVWVSLKTGLIFMDQAIPYNPQNPTAYLLTPPMSSQVQAAQGAQPTLSVQQYCLEAFDNIGTTRSLYGFTQNWRDVAPWKIEAYEEKITPPPYLSNLFDPIVTSQVSKGQGTAVDPEVVYPPRLLIPTLNQFRSGIKGVTGFLPATQTSPAPAIAIQQFQGNGLLNMLLGNPTSTTYDANALSAALQSNPDLQSAAQDLYNAQQSLALLLANPQVSTSAISAATDSFTTAKKAFLSVVNNVAGINKGLEGLNPTIDINGYGIYLYETDDTPIAQFLKSHRPSPFIPAKDYVIFLDINKTIVPLFETVIATDPTTGLNGIQYDTTQINGNIQYMTSLVTGITYSYNQNGPGEIIRETAGGVPDQTVCLSAIGNLLQQIQLIFYGDNVPSNTIVNQITAVANLATCLASQGPLLKSGYSFSKVDFATFAPTFSQSQSAQAADALAVNGDGFIDQNTAPKFSGDIDVASFGTVAPASSQKNWLEYAYVYQVAKVVPASEKTTTSSQLVGALGTDKNGEQVYDYVVPVTVISGTTNFQMVPLGMAEALESGASVSNNSLLISLVTGQVYDFNYVPLAGSFTATVLERNDDFTLVQNPASTQYQVMVPMRSGSGSLATIVKVPVAAVPGLPLATAFMPTAYNPYNVIMANIAYDQDPALTSAENALTAANTSIDSDKQVILQILDTNSQVGSVWDTVQKYVTQYGPKATLGWLQNKDTYGWIIGQFTQQSVGQTLEAWVKDQQTAGQTFAQSLEAWVKDQQTAEAARAAYAKQLSLAQSSLSITNLKAVPKQGSQLLKMLPLYWMHYTNFVYNNSATSSTQSVSFGLPGSQQSGTASFNWLTTDVSSGAQPMTSGTSNIPLCLWQALPQRFTQDQLLPTYNGWTEVENQTNAIAEIMQAGPFNFTKGIQYNVYLSIAKSNYQNGNYFYQSPAIFGPNEYFVVGDMGSYPSSSSASTAASLTASGAKPSTSNTTLSIPSSPDSSLNIDSLGLGQSLCGLQAPVMVSCTDGKVYMPNPNASSAFSSSNSYLQNVYCSLIQIGQFDPTDVLTAVLRNESSQDGNDDATLEELLTTLEQENPSLYNAISSMRAINQQQQQAALQASFASKNLLLRQEEATNGTYIYAVMTGQNTDYLQANDYWVVCNASGNPVPAQVTAKTGYMVSLVNYNVYGANSATPIANAVTVNNQGPNGSTLLTLSIFDLFNQFFAAGPYAGMSNAQSFIGTLAAASSDVTNRIEELVTLANSAYIDSDAINGNAKNPPVAPNGILTSPFPQTLQSAQVAFTGLYQDPVSKKYFLYMPGTQGASDADSVPSYCYDFNATVPNPTYSNGSWSYSLVPKDGKRGVHYMVSAKTNTDGSLSITSAVPISQITGYPCQAMRARYGVNVNAQGVETLGLPVYNPPLPMTSVDQVLQPGKATTGTDSYMQFIGQSLLPSSGIPAINNTYQDYYYYNTAAQMYVARRVLSTQLPLYNRVTKTTQTTTYTEDFYVDLTTGEKYHINGQPYLMDVAVGYYVASTTNAVPNKNLDYSDPLFVWSEDNLLGESTNLSMMYQNLIVADPNYGYSQYTIQPNSTVFTLANGSGALTTYAYSDSTDENGNLYIAINGSETQSTDMAGALTAALAQGNYLVSKSCTMSIAPAVATPASISTSPTAATSSSTSTSSTQSSVGTASTTAATTTTIATGVSTTGAASSSSSSAASVTVPTSSVVTLTQTYLQPKQYSVTYTSSGYTDSNGNPVNLSVTDTFQVPIAKQDAGANQHYYNNPPLDDVLQNQLVQGIPFCATVLGSRQFGQTGIQPLATNGLGVNPVLCGVLSQPSAQNSYIEKSGILGMVFTGANGNGSGSVNQFFAYYNPYNNSPEQTISVGTSTGISTVEVPALATGTGKYTQLQRASNVQAQVGSYSFYCAVGGGMQPSLSGNGTNLFLQNANWYNNNGYPGLYAGNFVQSLTGAQENGLVVSGAPYIAVSAAINNGTLMSVNNTLNKYSAPSSNTVEYLYRYLYSTLSQQSLTRLLDKVNVVFAQNSSFLISGLSTSLQTVSVANQSVNATAANVLQAQVSYAKPIITLVNAPTGRYLFGPVTCTTSATSSSAQSSSQVLTLLSDTTTQQPVTLATVQSTLCSMYPDLSANTYIDIMNGIVFEQKQCLDGSSILYPAGFEINGYVLNLIRQLVGNPMPAAKAEGTLTMQMPTVTKANSSVTAVVNS